MTKTILKLFPLMFLVVGCIGTDILEDTIVAVSITEGQNALLVDETFQFDAKLINSFGDELNGDLTWTSANPNIVSVDPSGLVRGVEIGQTEISVSTMGFVSDPFLVSVVQDPNSIASVAISVPANSIDVGETIQFSASVFNLENVLLEGVPVTWSSSNAEVVSIDQTGLAIGVTNGTADITASADGIFSQSVTVSVGDSQKRTGTFEGLNGYRVSGSASLEVMSDGELLISLGDDFLTQRGPGLYVYLANDKNARSGGVEIAKLESTAGASTYTVQNIKLDDFNFVQIYCSPFGIPFGAAELE